MLQWFGKRSLGVESTFPPASTVSPTVAPPTCPFLIGLLETASSMEVRRDYSGTTQGKRRARSASVSDAVALESERCDLDRSVA